jgi:surface protein
MPNSNGWGDGTANNTIGWGQGSINNTIGWGSTYAVSDAGLTDIVGASPAPPAFAFTAKTDNTGVSTSTQFKLPLTTSTGLNIVVDWGDATTSTITSHLDAAVTHTYASAGTYSISITGTLPGFQFNNAGDKLKILNISSWGVLDITTNRAFTGCTNLTCSATDAPTITTTDLSFTFADCTNFNGAIGNWDVSGVTNMEGMFSNAPAFNQPLNWDTSAVTNMFRMFRAASAFNATARHKCVGC